MGMTTRADRHGSLELERIEHEGGFSLAFSFLPGPSDSGAGSPATETERVLAVRRPASVEEWSGGDDLERHAGLYDTAEWDGDALQASATVLLRAGGRATLVDRWHRAESDTWQVDRRLSFEGAALPAGLRLRLGVSGAFAGGAPYGDFSFFAPSASYNGNDLDEDGVDDFLPSRTLSYRDDRLNALCIMAYHRSAGRVLTLIRQDLPQFDDFPVRDSKEHLFSQETDIGSLGYAPDTDAGAPQLLLEAAYPFDEGERSLALDLEERSPWGAVWPTAAAREIEVSYQVRIEAAKDFHSALWGTFSRRVGDLAPAPVELAASLEEINDFRAEALDRYYLEIDEEADPNEPAGYVMNCHPQSGEQIADIIQYGFTGQNTLNAWTMLKTGDPELRRKAVKTIDFFVTVGHLPETGLFYDLYNNDKKAPDCWWTGLLLPLAYAQPGGSLEELMGPLYLLLEDTITALMGIKGSYLRCMSESAYGVLLAYRQELQRGVEHPHWLAAVRRYGEFLLGAQERDGSWYRAYDHDGNRLTEPAKWFGLSPVEQKSSSATPIQTLVALSEITGDVRYLDAAERAGRFVRSTLVDPVRFNGGVHDPIYAKAQLVDNEGILYPMLALLALHKATGYQYFLDGALEAARLYATWTWLWDVPLPESSTLGKQGFRSTGIGACDTCSAGYVHPFELLGVPELVELGELSGDTALIDVAELILFGCNQTVAVPGKDWGYRYPGLQEEGYFLSWWLADDPMFEHTAFGDRWKGEGNKTCFPWIPAVAMACHWKLIDRYGTTDLAEIRQRLSMSTALAR
jgi:hypothetical protein